jgi:hypothetical protein
VRRRPQGEEMKCNNTKPVYEEFECIGCEGTGRDDYHQLCDLCGGAGFYMDWCCDEHGEEQMIADRDAEVKK